MSNLLALPFKKTYQVEIKDAATNYISQFTGTHPDEFRDDIKRWLELRSEGTGGVVHEDRINSSIL